MASSCECSNRVEEKGSKATVSTHPKYAQDLHQNYAKYASVSKKGVISVDYTAEMPEMRGKAYLNED
jgi:hypothetical protein